MKTKVILVVLVCALPIVGCSAQKVKKQKGDKVASTEQVVEETVEEDNLTITEECLTNISLFQQSAKNKQYADAVEPWYQVYETCPSANKAIYTRGPQIIAWQISEAQDASEKARLRNLLMEVYDKRIKYFGTDPKYPRAYILGQKGMDYCEYFTDDELKLPAYGWLKESVQGMGSQSSLNVVNKFAELANALYKSDPDKNGEQYIQDYQLVSDVLTGISNDASSKYQQEARSSKEYVDNVFALSGAADCAKLDELYRGTVSENANNLEMLDKIMKLYRRVRCTESDVYFAAAENSHRLQPTAESAAGCAAMSAKKGDYKQAVEYYDQAVALSDNDEDKANYLYNIAAYYYSNLGQYSTARQYARKSLEVDPSQGRCYMLIGLMYANSKPYDDAVLNKTVYWAAVDKFQKAKQVDPSVAEEAQKLINSYSKYFPTTEEIFFNASAGLVKGKSFTVGGWIQESTICR